MERGFPVLVRPSSFSWPGRVKTRTPGPRSLSATTVRQARSYLRLCLTKAERLGYVNRNVAKLVELPPSAHREMKCLTPERAGPTDLVNEQRYLRASLYALFVVLIHTGVRPGEAAGLNWEDLDGPVLRVRRALKEIRV